VKILSFDFPWPPTANNLYPTVRGKRVSSKAALAYRKACADAVLERHIERFRFVGCRLRILIGCHAPKPMAYDLDNRIKATLDALQYCGIIENDNQIDEIMVSRFAPHHELGKLNIVIEEIPP
jgi:Holliday junction resolvase RusA-like endonuclease